MTKKDAKKSDSKRKLMREAHPQEDRKAPNDYLPDFLKKGSGMGTKKEELNQDKLDKLLLGAVMAGRDEHVAELMDQGADVNVRHPRTGASALHIVAASSAGFVLDELVKSDKLDYLVKDRQGRFPSALAMEVADDVEMGEFLMRKEIEQAQQKGVDYRALLEGEVDVPPAPDIAG